MSDCGCFAHDGFQLRSDLIRSDLAQRTSLEGLAPLGDHVYIDKVGSVSGLELERDLFVHDDEYLDQQYRRFHNGS